MDVEYVDASNFGVFGFSMGGMTALYYAAYSDKRPQCVLSICGTPDLGSLVDRDVIFNLRINGERVPFTSRREAILFGAQLIEHSSDQNMEKLLSVPLLLINGDADVLVPLEPIKAFEEKAKAYPNQLTVIIQEGRTHDFQIGDMNLPEVRNFLQSNLPVTTQK